MDFILFYGRAEGVKRDNSWEQDHRTLDTPGMERVAWREGR